MGLNLVWPASEYLESYRDALHRGWSPDNRRPEASVEEIARIEADPVLFLEQQVDRDARGPAVLLPDGTAVPRLPGYARWMWDGDFCGTIGFRWQPGTTDLPPHCLGHIGYSVVPWKRRLGYATRALALMLADVRNEHLPFVDLVTEVTNVASQRVIESNGGTRGETFRKQAYHGGGESYRYRIALH